MSEKEKFKKAVLEMIDEQLPEEAFTRFNRVALDIKFRDGGHKGFGFLGYISRCNNEIIYIKEHEKSEFLSAIMWGKEFKRPVCSEHEQR